MIERFSSREPLTLLAAPLLGLLAGQWVMECDFGGWFVCLFVQTLVPILTLLVLRRWRFPVALAFNLSVVVSIVAQNVAQNLRRGGSGAEIMRHPDGILLFLAFAFGLALLSLIPVEKR